MKHETQVALMKRFFDLRDRRTTTSAPEAHFEDPLVYVDPDRAQLEFERLFAGRPLLVALSCDLPDAGSYYATECAGLPLLLVRSDDGVVRGFANICRHRGGRVACGRGQAGRAFKCPYHSWAYDLEGALLGQPIARDGFAGLDRGEYGLLPVSVAERYGLIFATTEGEDAIDVEAELCGLGPEIAEFGIEDYVPFAQRSRVSEANWKLLYDTFGESYHIFSLHRESLAPQLLSTPLVSDFFGPHARMLVMTRNVAELLEQDESQWDVRRYSTIIYNLYPNALLNFTSIGHLDRWEVYPDPRSPERAYAAFTTYVPRDRADETRRWEANVALTERAVFGEDFGQQEDIQRSLRCGRLPRMVFGRNEPVLIHHHEVTDALLTREAA